MWGGRCHGFCVPNTGMGQGGGTGQKHPFSAEVVRRRSAGSEAGQGGAEVGSLGRVTSQVQTCARASSGKQLRREWKRVEKGSYKCWGRHVDSRKELRRNILATEGPF